MNPQEFFGKTVSQEDLDKMRPSYWEATWYRRIYVTVKWEYRMWRDRQYARIFGKWQDTWTPEEWKAYAEDNDLPASKPWQLRWGIYGK